MKRKILILGGEGLLGGDLTRYLREFEDFEVISLGRNKADITDLKVLDSVWQTTMPQYVINCGAYTNVDLAEKERDLCKKINVDAVQNLIFLSSKYKTKLIHISTASVLGSNKQEELSNTNKQSPVNYYSETKAMAENLCSEYINQGGSIYVLRTYWLYGTKNSDFVSFVRKSLEEKIQTRIVSDQFGQPTSTSIVFKIVQLILSQEILPGVYPSTASGSASRLEWAYKIADLLKLDKKFLIPVLSNEFEAAAIRPVNATLSHEIWHKQKLEISKWDEVLEEFLNGIT